MNTIRDLWARINVALMLYAITEGTPFLRCWRVAGDPQALMFAIRASHSEDERERHLLLTRMRWIGERRD